MRQGKGAARFELFELVMPTDSEVTDETGTEKLVQSFEGERAKWLPALTDGV